MTPRRYSIGAAASLLFAASLACTLSGAPPLPPTPAEEAVALDTPPPQAAKTHTPAPASRVPTLTPWPTPEAPVITSDELRLADLYARVNPSVVSILAELGGGDVSQGSGFVFDTSGHIVTNQHVVEGAQNLEVDFASGLKLRGEVIGADPHSDLAVIRVQGPTEGLAPLPLADSDQVRVGQTVVAIGNPFGLAGTMTVGILSGLGRALASNQASDGGGSFTAPDILQTDAAINPGNSGGPLINLNGEVVGVNKAIESQTGVNSGVGFAIASNTVRQVAPYLIEEGRFIYPYLGMSSSLDDITLTLQELLGLPQATGAYVRSVVPGGPSDQGGLRGDSAPEGSLSLNGDGDLIVGVDGIEVRSFTELMSYLVNHTRPGQEITLRVLRDGEPLDLAVVLGERP
ncbi:MAG: trypsin-like peptidase domain-containing protein [Anaerolineales bacterium]|nr:trypsin-like peptidase domain-containing protein [Anaerolineales bacterium]